jgi:hypothetical protein
VKPLFGANSSIARSRPAKAKAPAPVVTPQSNGGAPRALAPVTSATELTAAHPEVYVAAAFAAGVALAIFARRLAR